MTTTRWKVEKHTGTNVDAYLVREDNHIVVGSMLTKHHAAQIVREHNAHVAMVEALEQAAAGFATIANNSKHSGCADNNNLDAIRGFAHENFCIAKAALRLAQKGE